MYTCLSSLLYTTKGITACGGIWRRRNNREREIGENGLWQYLFRNQTRLPIRAREVYIMPLHCTRSPGGSTRNKHCWFTALDIYVICIYVYICVYIHSTVPGWYPVQTMRSDEKRRGGYLSRGFVVGGCRGDVYRWQKSHHEFNCVYCFSLSLYIYIYIYGHVYYIPFIYRTQYNIYTLIENSEHSVIWF